MSETGSGSEKLAVNGLRFTKIYLITLIGGLPAAALFGFIELHPLQLSEFGDFLAGAFGPLAIFWLVLGFFQQGSELKNSANALKLQAKELQNSVQQQAKLAKSASEQIDFEKQRFQQLLDEKSSSEKGNFVIVANSSFHSGEFIEHYIDITNLGHSVAHFAFLHGEGVDAISSDECPDVEMEYPVWERFRGRRYCYRLSKKYEGSEIQFTLYYTNPDGEMIEREFLMVPKDLKSESFDFVPRFPGQ